MSYFYHFTEMKSMSSWRNKFCTFIGGNFWKAAKPVFRPWKLVPDLGPIRFLRTWTMLGSFVLCRFLGHAVDGREWGGLNNGTADVWCSRCFYWHRRVPIDDLSFGQKIVDVTKEVKGDL